MTAHELLVRLRALNVRIFPEGERLRVVEPASDVVSEELWDELQRNKAELLRILEHAAQSGKSRSPIARAERPRNLPLSSAQQRLWFLAQMEGVSDAYNIPVGLRLSGELDRRALRQALDRIVWRHEALRTSFHRAGGEPVQCVAAPDCGFELREHDLSGHENAAAELEQLKREEAVFRFDLENRRLIHGQLIRLAAREHVLLITVHHIVFDGWSLGILVRELSALYRAYHSGEKDSLPLPAIQPADYALWQQQRLNSDVLRRESEYWLRMLKGAPPLLELPTDRARPARQTFAGDTVKIALDAGLTRALKALAHRHEVTLYMLAAAAWSVVLSRLSGQKEVVIGTVVANRARPEIEALIGFFVNTLALRVEVAGSVAELLRMVKARTLGAQEHQELPFEQVVEIVKPPRSLAHTPIFQVMLAWQGRDERSPDFGDLKSAFEPVSSTMARFDLALDLREDGDRIVGGLRYPTALFDRATIERHAGYLRTALEAMVADSRQAASAIDLLSPAERALLLETWNAVESPHPEHLCIHQLFEEQVRLNPQATAIVCEEQSLTYFELNRRANRLARHLIRLGVRPDGRVALCMERSPEMMVGILAVLKAGGAYVPLDPAYPVERLEYMLADSAPIVLLMHLSPDLRVALSAVLRASSIPLVDLQADALEWTDIPGDDLNPATPDLTPQHLAYVIYTSGSTGRPRGVMVGHSNVVRLFSSTRDWFSFDRNDVWTLFHSYAFDFSVWEIWGALLHGAKLVIVPRVTTRSPREFCSLLCTEGVTILNQTPGAFRQLIAAQDVETQHRLRCVIFGGEALEVSALRPWYERDLNRKTRLINIYGITETTVHVTYCPLEEADTIVSGPSPIGRRIPDLKIFILDEYLRPAPIGATGEMYVGGPGVARGYLNRPELTAERFIVDPFSADPGARLYKTGDLARFRPGGDMEYMGRNDQQVKIRGFRIEPGEIEARLAEHPGVHEAIVLVREDHPGDKRLVAWITAKGDSTTDAEALRRHLSALLPEYMVPAAYVFLEKIPLTPNGKVDHKALPSPQAGAYATREYEPPTGKRETTVARVWAEVLKRDRIGRNDNFFDLGGHSLLIVRVTRMLRQFGIETTVANLFNHPTVAAFAESLSRIAPGAGNRGVLQIREGTQPPLFMVHDGDGEDLYISALTQYLPADLSVYGLPCVPADEPQPRTMQAMAHRLIALMQQVASTGPYRLAGWSFGGVLAYEIAQQLLDRGEAVEFLGLIDALNPESLGSGESHNRTPEEVLRDLCEKQRMARSQERSSESSSEIADLSLSFDELFSHYSAIQALPGSFEDLTPQEARLECIKQENLLQVMEAYHPRPIGIPVHLFAAGERVRGGPSPTASLGWENCVPEYLLHVQTMSGNHVSLLRRPHIRTLGLRLTESLAAAVTSPHSLNVVPARAGD